MEQHPIPQDVTGFQFKLIGTMTVKQFGYVAVGAIFAVISWYAPLHGFLWQVLTKGILVPIFGVSGVVIAFVPIEGRPIDVMAVNFMHALLSPNQYIYIKKGRKFSFTQVSYTKILPQNTPFMPAVNMTRDSKKEERLHQLLAAASYKDAKSSLDQKERVFLQSLTPVSGQLPNTQARPGSVLQPVIQVNTQTKGVVVAAILPKRTLTQSQVSAMQNALVSSTTKPITASINADRQIVSQKKQPIAISTHSKPTPQIHFHMPAIATQNPAHSLLSDTPNVIIGIVKDSRGNMLPNILAEVKDKDGTPVRAFKTNPLGQFASATALPNGNYTLELEDPKKLHAFEVIRINAKGEIMQPIEIVSHDAREELRKALFN